MYHRVHFLRRFLLLLVLHGWLNGQFNCIAQGLNLLPDTLTPKDLISACASFREASLDDIIQTMVEFNLLCDSLQQVSAHPDSYEKFRHSFFEEALALDEINFSEVIRAAMPYDIYFEKGHRKRVMTWAKANYWPLVQMLFLLNKGIIEDKPPYKLTSLREFWSEVSFYDIRRGNVFVDVGAGSGTISFILGATGFPSRIYMTEVDEEMIDLIDSKLSSMENGWSKNLRIIRGAEEHLGLGDTIKADRILMREVFHHLKDKNAILEAVRRHLTNDGRLVLVESTIESETNKKIRCIKAMHNDEIETWLKTADFTILEARQSGSAMLYSAVPNR